MMSWLRAAKREDGPRTVDPEEGTTVYKSLALNILSHQFREGHKYQVLDLGPPISRNIEFFTQFPCKLYIENFYDTLNSFDYFSPEDGFSYEAVFCYLMPYPKTVRFDIILAWDLFDYLEREVFRHLTLHLGRFSAKGTLLFSLISTNRHTPETPYRFTILDRENLLYEPTSHVLRACPRYEQKDLTTLLPNFRVCNSFYLRNGFKEYLFMYE
jgi:hypothetical protein